MHVAEKVAGYCKITGPSLADDALKDFHDKNKEHFLVLTLNAVNEVIAVRIVTIGLLNQSLVHPREVFWWAIKDNAAYIVLAHNHPSGNTNPSNEDLEITEKLVEASKIMGIDILDHIIFSENGYYSFRENGKLEQDLEWIKE